MKTLNLSLPRACAILTLAALVIAAAVGCFAHDRSGIEGVAATCVATLVCWSSAIAALVVTTSFRDSPLAVHGMLLAIGLRTGLPLLAGVVSQIRGGWLAEAGLLGCILACYLLTLIVETLLSLAVGRKYGEGQSKGLPTNG